MRFLIDFIFILFSFWYLFLAIFRRKPLAPIGIRFFLNPAELKKELGDKRPIWLHAVSVGETISAGSLVELLHSRFSKEKIVVSTVTSTGNSVARKIFPKGISIVYLPLDLSFAVRRSLSFINPKLFILTEAEIWPNLILELKRRKIPIALINGRISDKSFRGYTMLKFLFLPLLCSINLFCMRTQDDASKVIKLGVPRERVKVTGSTKFDLALSYKLDKAREENLRRKLNISDKDTVMVCGSTHKPEEKIIAGIFLELSKEYHNLKLIVAPRHIERAARIKKLYDVLGLPSQFYSSLVSGEPASKRIIIVDKIGVLRDLYALCTLAFVGGSLTKHGGQNFLEPAGFKKAVFFGKWIYNFKQEAKLLIESGGAIMVENGEDLKETLFRLLADKKKLKIMGEAAHAALEQNSGTTLKNLELIQNLLEVTG